jgi:hypothetical protein
MQPRRCLATAQPTAYCPPCCCHCHDRCQLSCRCRAATTAAAAADHVWPLVKSIADVLFKAAARRNSQTCRVNAEWGAMFNPALATCAGGGGRARGGGGSRAAQSPKRPWRLLQPTTRHARPPHPHNPLPLPRGFPAAARSSRSVGRGRSPPTRCRWWRTCGCGSRRWWTDRVRGGGGSGGAGSRGQPARESSQSVGRQQQQVGSGLSLHQWAEMSSRQPFAWF